MKPTLYFIEVDDLNNFVEYDEFMDFLSPEKQMQINKFRFDIDKKLGLFSDLLVRYIACKLLNLSNNELLFNKNAYGKPYLLGFPDFQFNISHTRNAIAIAISQKEVGVDIEKIKTADLKIAERFFTKCELDYILSEKTQKEALFYEIWTKKEAYIKWIGKGLSLPLTGFDVTSAELGSMMKVIKINDYAISVCSYDNFDRADTVKLNENRASLILTEFACSSYAKV